MEAVTQGVGRMVSQLGKLLGVIMVGLVAGLSAVGLGTKALVLVPAMAVGFVLIMTPYSPLFAIVAAIPVNVEIAGPITVIRLAIVYAVFAAFLQGMKGQAPKMYLPLPEGGVPLCFFIWIFFATVAVSEGELVNRLGGFLIHGIVFFFVLMYVDTLDRFRKVMLTLVIVGLVQVALVVGESRFGIVVVGGFQAELAAQSDEEVRAIGTSAHPIFLASFFQIVMVFGVFLMVTTRYPLMRIIMLASVAMFLFAWYNTWSRSSWIGMAAMIGLTMMVWSKGTRVLAVIGGGLVFVLLATHDFSMSAVIRTIDSLAAVQRGSVRAGVSESTQSFSWRTENWSAAVSIWASSPVFGVGIDRVHTFMLDHLPPGALGHRFVPAAVPHNMFLQVLAEAGLPALLLFIWIWITAIIATLRAWSVRILRPYAFAILVVLGGQFTTFLFNPIPREIWFSLAMALVLGRMAKQHLATQNADPTTGEKA